MLLKEWKHYRYKAFMYGVCIHLRQTSFMEKRQKMELMDKMLRELDDLKNSQTSVLKKITQVEAENINAGISLLDQELPDIHEKADANLEGLSQLLDKLQQHRDEFVKKHQLDVVEV